jgi:hypothetical protein
MKKLFLSAVIALSSILALGQNKIKEGTITYGVEWTLPPNANPQMASMLPAEMKVYFKGDSAATTAKSPMSSSTTITNPKTDFVRLLLDVPMMQKKFSVRFTPADLEEMQDQWPQFELTAGTENKTLAGYKAQKYAVKEKKSGKTFDAWFTKDVDIIQNSLNHFFDKSYGFPLEFNTVQNGMGIKATVKALQPEKIPAGSFSATKDYEEITFEQLKGMMGGR